MYKLLLFLAGICAARAQFGFEYQPQYERTWVGDAIDKATMKLVKASYELAEDKNVVSSPLGLMLLLSLYTAGANQDARDEINRFLAGPDYEKKLADSIFSALSQRLSGFDPEYLTLANKVYVSDKYSLTDLFALSAASYRSDVDLIDFTNPQNAVNIINQWAAEVSKSNIQTPVSANDLDPEAALALFNLIYFKGHWHVPFNATETKEKDFHVDRQTTVKKPMMHLLRSLYYFESEELGARMVELPYKEHGFRMVVVLPNEVDGLPSVLEKAAELGVHGDVLKLSSPYRKVELDMPKFEARSKLDFNAILPKVGVSKLFEEPAPNIVQERPLIVSKVFQEAFIKVDEEGATAGAFTGMIIYPMSEDYVPPPPLVFTVDRPFLYTIIYEDKILFAGTHTK